jgi:hypothetical protein
VTAHPRRRLAVAALASLAVAPLAACQSSHPITAEPYAASDGVDATLGSVRAGNLLVLAAADGAPGTVLGSLTNDSDRAVTVQVGLEDDLTSIDVAPGATELLGPDDTEVAVPAVPVAPGALMALRLSADAEGTTTVQVPVLDGTLPYYATLVPTP